MFVCKYWVEGEENEKKYDNKKSRETILMLKWNALNGKVLKKSGSETRE